MLESRYKCEYVLLGFRYPRVTTNTSETERKVSQNSNHLTDKIHLEWLHQEGLVLGWLAAMVASAQAASWYCHKESKILGNHLANLFQIVDWELRLKTVNWFAQHRMSVVDPGLEATVCLLDQTMAPFPTLQPSCQKTRQHSIHYQFRTTYSYSGYVAQWAIIL